MKDNATWIVSVRGRMVAVVVVGAIVIRNGLLLSIGSVIGGVIATGSAIETGIGSVSVARKGGRVPGIVSVESAPEGEPGIVEKKNVLVY